VRILDNRIFYRINNQYRKMSDLVTFVFLWIRSNLNFQI